MQTETLIEGRKQVGSRTESAGNNNWIWRAALHVFLLAGATGILYRMGMVYGLPESLHLQNVRHAHSHLMYFGWVTPLLMMLIAEGLQSAGAPVRMDHLRRIVSLAFLTALLSFPFFLLYGYTPAVIAGRRLPLSVMSAGLNIIAWYAFAACYYRWTKGVARNRSMQLWDLAVAFMVLATFGAWGLAASKPLGITSDTATVALTHVFLDLFSEGWFVLGVLGLAWIPRENRLQKKPGWTLVLLCLGLPTTFALGMPQVLVPLPLQLMARFGSVLVGAGLLLNALWLLQNGAGVWRFPLILLAMKALGQIGAGIIPGVWLSSQPGMRILYLHLMLLGFVTTGLLAALETRVSRRARLVMSWAVTAVLASLGVLSGYGPGAIGRGAFVAAAWISVLPVAAGVSVLLMSRYRISDTE